MKRKEKRFEFGKNWNNYLSNLTGNEINSAKKALKEWIGIPPNNKETFLDIGCGSGLSSLAAHLNGYSYILSFDYDNDSVKASKRLMNKYCNNQLGTWEIKQGSIIDKTFIKSLPKFNVVYSWGVLHHSGEMWNAIEFSSSKVKRKGKLFISIYNDQNIISKFWNIIKYVYVSSPNLVKKVMIGFYIIYFGTGLFIFDIIRLRNPLKRHYGDTRGMKFYFDVIDWIGGYPFEVAKPKDICDFVEQKGFLLLRIKNVGFRHGCNEYLFQKL